MSNYYIDPSTRVCFQGKYWYDCLLPKFPGYAVSTAPDTDTTIIKSSRGKLRLIEYSETAYGFSYVTNQKSQIQFSSSLASVTLSHVKPSFSKFEKFKNHRFLVFKLDFQETKLWFSNCKFPCILGLTFQ